MCERVDALLLTSSTHVAHDWMERVSNGLRAYIELLLDGRFVHADDIDIRTSAATNGQTDGRMYNTKHAAK